MWQIFKAIFTAVQPPEKRDGLSPEQLERLHQGWRQTVGWILTLLVGFAGFTLLAMAAGVPGVIPELVWDTDVEQKTIKVVDPIAKKVDALEQAQEDNTEATKALLAKVAEDQIFFAVKRRCHSRDDDEREFLTKYINKYLEEYELVTADTYRVPTCDEIEFREEFGEPQPHR